MELAAGVHEFMALCEWNVMNCVQIANGKMLTQANADIAQNSTAPFARTTDIGLSVSAIAIVVVDVVYFT